ncbi:resolvase [Micromonospora chersina]|uniref:resolvase n=1 Tax=Micromonospora chersina TaxID=47854 RepID=UPI00371FF5CF
MTDPLAAEARRLRVEEQLSVQQIQARLGIGRDRAYALLRGVPPPEWTRRPRARDATRAEAERLRAAGRSVNEIAEQLGAKSTAYQWVRHLPLNPDEATAQRRQAHSKAMTDARWGAYREARDAAQAAEHERAAGVVGALDERDLLMLGAAMGWWAERLRLPVERFGRPTRKRHNATTVHRNTGDDYHGCLVITVPRSRQLYWRIEGVIAGIRAAVEGAAGE